MPEMQPGEATTMFMSKGFKTITPPAATSKAAGIALLLAGPLAAAYVTGGSYLEIPGAAMLARALRSESIATTLPGLTDLLRAGTFDKDAANQPRDPDAPSQTR